MAQAIALGTPAAPPTSGMRGLRPQVVGGIALGLVAVFTGFAAVPAIATGMVIGGAERDRRLGRKGTLVGRATRVLAVSGGMLAIMAIGQVSTMTLAAFLVVPLVGRAERLLPDASSGERIRARIVYLAFAGVAFAAGIGALLLALASR